MTYTATLRSQPRVDGRDVDRVYATRYCDRCQVALAAPLGSAPAASIQCPACGERLGTTTRRLRAGFVVLTAGQVADIHRANGYAKIRPALNEIDGERYFVNAALQAITEERLLLTWGPATAEGYRHSFRKAGLPAAEVARREARLAELDALSLALREGEAADLDARERAVWKRIKREPVNVWGVKGEPDAAPAAEAPAAGAPAAPVRTARQAALLESAIAKLAKWDANPRCKWCLAYRAGKNTDLCAHHAESVKYYGRKVTQHEQADREWNLRNRRDLADNVVKYGGTPPPCPYADRIEGLA